MGKWYRLRCHEAHRRPDRRRDNYVYYSCVDFGARLLCVRSEEHTSELQSPCNLVCRLLLEKKKHLSVIQPLCRSRGTPWRGCRVPNTAQCCVVGQPSRERFALRDPPSRLGPAWIPACALPA